MRVLLPAISSANTPDGILRHAVNLARCLLHLDDLQRVDLVVGTWQAPCVRSILGNVDPRLRLHAIPIHPSSLARNRWYYSQLPHLARHLQSDLVHLAYPVPLNTRRLLCPVVVTLHDLYPYDVPENFEFPRVLANRLILEQCLAAADRIACVSGSTLDRLAAHRPALIAKAKRLYNCVEAGPEAAPLDWPAQRPFVLSVAQHRRNKNILLTLQVFEQLLQRSPDLLLVIVGNPGPETPAIHAAIRDHPLLRQRVVLLDNIPEQQLQWCYRHCELLLATSTVEGFGLPIVEAMLAGCPVVCSDIAAFREFGESHCQLVRLDQTATAAFVAAVTKVRNMPRPQPLALPHLSGPSIASTCIQLYRELLLPSRGSTGLARCEVQKGASV